MTKKIIWMADEAIGNSKPTDWNAVIELTKKLIAIAGNKSFEHEVLDPRACWQNLVRKITGKDFTTIIDLTGMFGPALRELFPQASVVEDFKISRIREISSHGLPTTGHLLSLTPQQLRQRKQQLDLHHTLIIDDTSFSGTSSEIAMQAWGLLPEETCHGFLLANTGWFSTKEGSISGAANRLQAQGSQVFFGHEIHTPEEDGWHTKDLHDHPQVESSLQLSLLIQAVAKEGNVDTITQLLQNPDIQQAISSECFDFTELTKLHKEGRIHISDEVNVNAIHARNPLLWAIPAFAQHIDITNIINHQDQIAALLKELHSLTNNQEGKTQAQDEFKREARQILQQSIEGPRKGGERL